MVFKTEKEQLFEHFCYTGLQMLCSAALLKYVCYHFITYIHFCLLSFFFFSFFLLFISSLSWGGGEWGWGEQGAGGGGHVGVGRWARVMKEMNPSTFSWFAFLHPRSLMFFWDKSEPSESEVISFSSLFVD